MEQASLFDLLDNGQDFKPIKSTDWKWSMATDYPEKNGLKVFSCFACGGGSTMGYKITYEKQFYTVYSKGQKAGNIYGFPLTRSPWCNDRLKMKAQKNAVNKDDVCYVGIAYDEKARFKILNKNTVSPLELFGIDEDLCGLHCMYEGILSPSYESSYRDGCWFCHNQGVNPLRTLRKKHPQLWALLLKWDNDSPIPFKANGHTVHDYERRFEYEDLRLVPTDATFRWQMLYEDRQMMMEV